MPRPSVEKTCGLRRRQGLDFAPHAACAPILVAATTAIAASLAPLLWRPLPTVLWNATSSAPVGLYLLVPGQDVRRGTMVAARIPKRFRTLAAARRYIPPGVPLIKRVAATSGDRMCAAGMRIFARGHYLALRRARDGAGRPLPAWRGCKQLRRDQVLLLTRESGASFDGRYFGPSPRSDILGRVVLLWRA